MFYRLKSCSQQEWKINSEIDSHHQGPYRQQQETSEERKTKQIVALRVESSSHTGAKSNFCSKMYFSLVSKQTADFVLKNKHTAEMHIWPNSYFFFEENNQLTF